MTRDTRTWRSRADFRNAPGVLLVLRPPADAPPPAAGQPPAVPADPAEGLEVLLALLDDGQVIALAGHVDLGTGLATAYGQIVAEELDLPLAAVQVILGDTARAPHQGATIASSSIQLHAQPLRTAAAQAKAWLLAQAAARSGAAVADLLTQHGAVITPDAQHLTYAALVAGQHVELSGGKVFPLDGEPFVHTFGGVVQFAEMILCPAAKQERPAALLRTLFGFEVVVECGDGTGVFLHFEQAFAVGDPYVRRRFLRL